MLGTDVHLSWSTDPVGIFIHHLAPMRHPTYTTGYCEEHGEHVLRDTDGLVDNTCVEVNIGVQFTLDEVVISQGLFLEVYSQVK